jgi:hypothetical protein
MGWKFKFIFIVFVFIAGFSTAIYLLAPNPQNANSQITQTDDQGFKFESYADKNFVDISSEAKKQQFIQTYNIGLHKCIAFSKDAFGHLNEFVNRKIEQKNLSRAN